MVRRAKAELESAVARFERDRSSGASELAQAAVRLLAQARRAGLEPVALERLAVRLARAHPAMAAIWNAVRAPDPGRWLRQARRRARRAAAHARRLLPRGGVVLTVSYSATVIEALQGAGVRVVVAQSLPGGEGTQAAKRLADRGLPVTLVPDAAVGQWAAAADAVLFGADALTVRGVINKVGSRLLALAAAAERIPCCVAADSSKLAPPASGFRLPLLGPGDWFEYVEWDLVTWLITERGARQGGSAARQWLTGQVPVAGPRRGGLQSGVPAR
jgi:hypothetical protein